MANIENTRSLYLANANPRLLTRASSDVLLSASAPLFKVDAAGTPNTPSITFDAIPISMDSSVTYSFSAVGGTLTGVAGRSATLLFTNMSAETATVTVTAIYRGTTYIRSTKVAKLVDIDPSDIEVDLSPENLKDILEGQITESELFGDLRDRIGLIDADVFTGGSVAARVKAETDSRILAVKAETDARVAALTQEASNRTTYVQGYTYSKAQANEAISIKADTITSAYTAYANAQRDVAISTASSDVRTYSYSKSDTNSAIAASATQLRSEFSSNNGASVSWVQEYAYSKSAIDSAEAAQTTSITSAYKSYADTQKTAAITAANADVRQYTYSKAETNGALASQSTDITTAYKSYADAAKGAAITAAAADVRTYSYSKSGTDSAIASTANTLRSEFASNNGASVAWVQNYAFSKADTTSAIASKADELRAEFSSTAGVTASYVQNYTYSKAQADSAIASATSQLSTTVGQHTSTLQTQATSLNGLSAQYTVKIDNNGYVTGYGLASTTVNGVPTSSFIINADRFAVVAPGIAPKVMFAVGNVNGQSTIGINGNVIVDGSFIMRNAAGVPVVTLTGLQPGFEAPDTKNADLDPVFAGLDTPQIRWDFDTSDLGFSTGGTASATLVHNAAGYVVWTPTTANPSLSKGIPLASQFQGNVAPKIRARVKRLSGTGTWEGTAFYNTVNHSATSSYSKTISAPANPDAWNILEWDMENLTSGGSEWMDNIITNIRFDLVSSNSPASSWAIDWVAIGKFNTGVSPVDVAVAQSAITALTTDFNSSNNRNAASIAAPTISSSGSAVDHMIRTDGAADISFEWLWGGSEGDIDGFLVYVYQSSAATAYTFGTTPSAETAYVVPANKRAFILQGAAADLYTTFAVQAYRSVDSNVNASGYVKSSLVKPSLATENPYRPSTSVAFAGNITGTIDGTTASTVVSNAGAGKAASDAVNNATTGLAAKLSAAGNQVLSGPITLQSSGAVVVGTTTNGVITNTTGIIARKGGNTTFAALADGSVYVDGNISARSLTLGTPDNIIPDPKFKDLSWWGRTGSVVAQFGDAGQATGWKSGASLYLNKAAGELISYSEYFDLVPGATYRIEVQVALSNDFNGRASVYLSIPGDRDYAMVNRSAGQNWADGMPVQINAASPKGIITYATTYTIPASGTQSKGRIQIRNSHTVGNAEVGSPSITRVADADLVGDGVLSARHIIGDTLDVLAAKLGNLEIGPSGSIRQGMTNYATGTGLWFGVHGGVPKFSIGKEGGSMLTWDGTKLEIRDPTYSTDLGVSMGVVRILSQPNSVYSYWDKGVTISGTSAGPFQYRYTLQVVEGDIVILGDPTASVVRLRSRGNNSTSLGYLTVTVTDERGASKTASCQVQFQFGSGALY